jgi:hypothetical protein
MDTMRSGFGSLAESDGYDQADDETGREAPPAAIGQDERRMQVRAYNHWASLLNDRNFPAIEDLEPGKLPDFGPFSVLLDFSSGIENPGISYLGEKLAEECDIADEELQTLADVPSLSLLTRITDHYMQILANQAPIGFEAEFVNQRGQAIAYRGILLPFSSDDDTIDFIYGVINWKELADAQASDELLLEIDQALEPKAAPHRENDAPLTDWADGPGTELGAEPANDVADFAAEDAVPDERQVEEFAGPGFTDEEAFAEDDAEDEAESDDDDALPVPSFGLDEDEDEDDEPVKGPSFGSLLRMPMQVSKTPIELSDDFVGDEEADIGQPLELTDAVYDEPAEMDAPAFEERVAVPSEPPFDDSVPESAHAIELPELDPAEMGLGDWLASAREMAAAARSSEDRTRNALYDAIGRAYDFSLAAADAPAEFEELLADSGLTLQDRAPMTPVVKLVFGADYDKTRLTEYAAALTHAHRLQLPLGALGDFLSGHEGGLKGVVKAERRLRKEEAGKEVEAIDAPRLALAKKLRSLPAQSFEAIAQEGSEFALVMIRRTDEGQVVVLGEVPDDVALVERAARRLIG